MYLSNKLVTVPHKEIERVVVHAIELGARRATVYLSPKLVVNCTPRFQATKSQRSVELVVKIGKPNFRERAFIKSCLKASEPFPVKKVQLKFYK